MTLFACDIICPHQDTVWGVRTDVACDRSMSLVINSRKRLPLISGSGELGYLVMITTISMIVE
jgi:hypothetical protein